MNRRLSELNELERLQGYFSPNELRIIDQGQSLPGLEQSLDNLKYMRVAGVVINSLISSITPDSPVTVHSLTDDFIEEPGNELGGVMGELTTARVNDSWSLIVDVAAPRLDDPSKDRIDHADQVGLVEIQWTLTNDAQGEGGSLDDFYENDDDSILRFTRKRLGAIWKPTEDVTMPRKEQTDLLLLLGQLQQVKLPFAE